MIELNDILTHPEFERAKEYVQEINTKINGRICLSDHIHIIYIIKEMMKDSFENYLEIGTLHGGSMSLALQSRYGVKHIGIDLFTYYGKPSDPYDEKKTVVSKENAIKNVQLMNRYNHNFELFEGSSYNDDTVNLVKSKIDAISLLLIDGDHSFEGKLRDYNLYSPLVSSGGIIIFGTYGSRYWPEVKQAVDTIDKRGWHIIGAYGNGFFMQKK